MMLFWAKFKGNLKYFLNFKGKGHIEVSSKLILNFLTSDFVKTDFELRNCRLTLQRALGGNSQNFLSKFVRFFVTLRCFYKVVIHRK